MFILDPLNPLFAVLIYLIAFVTSFAISKLVKYQVPDSGRFASIDAFRGFLAVGVFIHHSAVWHQLLHTEYWNVPASNLFSQFGSTSVSFFFMITAFLFVGKLFDSKDKEFNWTKYFVSRFFRIAPLYYLTFILIFTLVMINTDWQIKESIFRYVMSIGSWMTFLVVKSLNINGFDFTRQINAGVVWSLAVEWVFYMALPLLSLLILKNKPSKKLLIICGLFVAVYFAGHGINAFYLNIIQSFAGGALAAYLIRMTNLSKVLVQRKFSVLVLGMIPLALQYDSSEYFICKCLLIIAFIIIALGNDMFGLLRLNSLKLLGDISYGIYLIHGIVLFITLYMGFGFESAKLLSIENYSAIILMLTPLLIAISYLSYRWIEKPCIDYGKKVKINVKL